MRGSSEKTVKSRRYQELETFGTERRAISTEKPSRKTRSSKKGPMTIAKNLHRSRGRREGSSQEKSARGTRILRGRRVKAKL